MSDEEYQYHDISAPWIEEYWQAIKPILKKYKGNKKTALDLGCGNGAVTQLISNLGFKTTGVEPSESGISIAQKSYPTIKFINASAYDDLIIQTGKFDIVTNIEVIEHCYFPKKIIKQIYTLLNDDGIAIITTPYHGYIKNLALSITGKWDAHFGVDWDHGHIKFFSEKTLSNMIQKNSLKILQTKRIGRIPCLAKSMLFVVQKIN